MDHVSLVSRVTLLVASIAMVLAARADSADILSDQYVPPVRMTRDQAVQQAELESTSNQPSTSMLEARVDGAMADLITASDAWRRQGNSIPLPEGWASHPTDPVWWITVQGYFRWASGPMPGGNDPVYEASQACYIYDASSGRLMGGGGCYGAPANGNATHR